MTFMGLSGLIFDGSPERLRYLRAFFLLVAVAEAGCLRSARHSPARASAREVTCLKMVILRLDFALPLCSLPIVRYHSVKALGVPDSDLKSESVLRGGEIESSYSEGDEGPGQTSYSRIRYLRGPLDGERRPGGVLRYVAGIRD